MTQLGSVPAAHAFDIRFPTKSEGLQQDQEWFEATIAGRRRRMLIHDYAALYETPGLYEALVYDALGCSSPARVVHLLEDTIQDWPRDPADLRVLDLGAGNGIVGECLRDIGVAFIVGLDILDQAGAAATRDRPNVYDDYIVTDLTSVEDSVARVFESGRFNCLVCVAALGFGDIPPLVFINAFNAIAEDGWIAMTIKEDFLSEDDDSGFARLLRGMMAEGFFELQAHQRYVHRESVEGEPLFYVSLVARKTRHVPADFIDSIEAQRAGADDVDAIVNALVADGSP